MHQTSPSLYNTAEYGRGEAAQDERQGVSGLTDPESPSSYPREAESPAAGAAGVSGNTPFSFDLSRQQSGESRAVGKSGGDPGEYEGSAPLPVRGHGAGALLLRCDAPLCAATLCTQQIACCVFCGFAAGVRDRAVRC